MKPIAKVLRCDPGQACRVIPGSPATSRRAPALPKFAKGLKCILVPVDFSARTRQALAYALKLATGHPARVVLVCAAAPVPYEADYGYGPVLRELPDEPALKKMRARLNAYARRNLPDKRRGEIVVVSGHPSDEIPGVARRLTADCIVICTRRIPGAVGEKGVSVAEQLIHLAPCPVLVLHEE